MVQSTTTITKITQALTLKGDHQGLIVAKFQLSLFL